MTMIYDAGMSVNHLFVKDTIQSIADTVATETDILDRLRMVVLLDREWRTFIVPARDEAAYEARRLYARSDLRDLTDISDQRIAYWERQHRARTGAPAIPARPRIDLSSAVDLRH